MIEASQILIACPLYILLVMVKLIRYKKTDIRLEILKAIFFAYLLGVVMYFFFPIVTDRICNPIGINAIAYKWLPEDLVLRSVMSLFILLPLGFFFPMYHRHYTQKDSLKIALMTIVLIHLLQIILSAYGYFESRPIVISSLLLNIIGFVIGSKFGLCYLTDVRVKKFNLIYQERN